MCLVSEQWWNLSNRACGMYRPLNSQHMTEEPVNRRKKTRLSLPLPVTINGADASGKQFMLDTVLENISASGVYLRLSNRPEEGTTLRLLIRFSVSPDTSQAARVAAHGDVIRIEEQKCGSYGVAIRFTNYRFL